MATDYFKQGKTRTLAVEKKKITKGGREISGQGEGAGCVGRASTEKKTSTVERIS